MERANFVAKIWKSTDSAMQNTPSPAGYGWDQEGNIRWIEEILPADITNIFLQTDDSDSEEEFFGDEEYEEEMDSDVESEL